MMNRIRFIINDASIEVDAESDTPLLWILRDDLDLTGTKFGCGRGLCGACTVLVNGIATRSCVLPIGSVSGKTVKTIEGLSEGGDHPLQTAWIEEDVPQCGYCQVGMIMSAAALIERQSKPSDDDIDDALAGHICRCGTYPRIRRAIHRAVSKRSGDEK